jgi:hypothetical protein
MGYFLTAEPEIAAPGKSFASPKTHTPFSRVEERGRRCYSPEFGEFVSRYADLNYRGKNLYRYMDNNSVREPTGSLVSRQEPPKSVGPYEGTIKCNSRCKLVSEGCDKSNWGEYQSLADCCEEHENVHKGQVGPLFCKWVGGGCERRTCPDAGKYPAPGTPDFGNKPLWPDLECPAHAVSIGCAVKKCAGASGTEKIELKVNIALWCKAMSDHSCTNIPAVCSDTTNYGCP